MLYLDWYSRANLLEQFKILECFYGFLENVSKSILINPNELRNAVLTHEL